MRRTLCPSLFTHVRPALHTCVERTRQRNQARTTMGESATPVKAVPEAASSSASPPPPTSAQIPPRPASKPVGELYRIRPWHTVIVLTLALLLDLPFLIDRLALSPYTSHTTGGVLVTGASTGIGRDAAITLATKEPGLIVYAGVRNLRDAKAITALHLPNLLPVTMDVTKDNSVQAARRTILKDLASRGPEPDNPLPFVGLVNNAGVTGMAPLEHHALPEVEKIFAVNVFGLLRVTQAFLPEIRLGRREG
ncbi:short-chain dehydrogenase reductase sdr, partial [Nannochloropsis gaditana]